MQRLSILEQHHIGYRWVGITAVEEYLDVRAAPLRFAVVEADMVELAPLFPAQRYVGLAEFDLAIEDELGTVYLRCEDGGGGAGGWGGVNSAGGGARARRGRSVHEARDDLPHPAPGVPRPPALGDELLNLRLDPTRRRFYGAGDPLYPLLRILRGRQRSVGSADGGSVAGAAGAVGTAGTAGTASTAGALPADPAGAVSPMDALRGPIGASLNLRERPTVVPAGDPFWAAVLAARLDIAYLMGAERATTTEADPKARPATARSGEPAEWWRVLLSLVLGGEYAWRGLEVMMRSGLIAQVLPELRAMDQTDQSKEGHPEGNVWRHTLESLRYRKQPNELVSLSLLFHDMGKPVATPQGQNRFHRHAELGATAAARAMRRLGYPTETTDAVHWLIRNHMIPGALEMLPTSRRGPIMASPLFPLLLEVYRCDLSSTYRSPEGYYSACRIYRRFLKHAANPYRSDEGKRLIRMYVA